jgi:flavin-dependent dehydrogenase
LTDYDQIIVGAGPAGSSCATILSRAGRRVLLCDRATFPRHKICGACLNPRTWRLFDLLGISQRLRRTALQVITGIQITSADGIRLKIGHDHNPEKPFVSIKRSVLDYILLQQAKETGATVCENTSVRRAERTEDRWQVTAVSGKSKIRFTAGQIIAADGRNSSLAKYLARNDSLPEVSHKNRIGLQWFTKYQTPLAADVGMYLTDSGYFGMVNLDKQTANLAMVTTIEMAKLARTNPPGFLKALYQSNPSLQKEAVDLTPVTPLATAFPINPTKRFPGAEEAYLIGDAAQTIEPFTGEGILLAVQDGICTANDILSENGYIRERIRARSPFIANRIFSPFLQNRKITDTVIPLGIRFPKATKSILNMILP